MLSHVFKCIFVHIPKNGGTSISRAFSPKGGKPSVPRAQDLDNAKSKYLTKHSTPDEYVQHLNVTTNRREWNPEEWFKFISVRNPWDRLVSAFFFDVDRNCEDTLKNTTIKDSVLSRASTLPKFPSIHGRPKFHDWTRVPLKEKASLFQAFVREDLSEVIKDKERLMLRHQSSWFMDDVFTYDYVIRFESLRAGWRRVWEINKWTKDRDWTSPRKTLKWRRRGTARRKRHRPISYHAFYDVEAQGIVEDLYRDDIEKFGYTYK